MIHRYASLPHYAEHLDPIWRALPEHVRGESWSPRSRSWWGSPLPAPRARPGGLVLVASFADVRKLSGRHRLVYVEHGAGQTYDGDPESQGNGSYSGGGGHGAVDLFLAPSDHVAERWRRRYDVPAVAVGSPKLDRWHGGSHQRRPTASTPLVAVTFHWNCQLIPETTWALPHYRAALEQLRDDVRGAGAELLGHGHPRGWPALRAVWSELGVPHTPHLADVLDQASVLVGDNTSALYEFASLDRPVVVLNAPWYRREVHHGLRFWRYVPGLQVDEPEQLSPVVLHALARPDDDAALRRHAVRHVYAATDGQAASRAAAAIVEVLSAEPVRRPSPSNRE